MAGPEGGGNRGVEPSIQTMCRDLTPEASDTRASLMGARAVAEILGTVQFLGQLFWLRFMQVMRAHLPKSD